MADRSACRRAAGLIHERLDGTLTPADAASLDAHLYGCPACRSRAEQLGALARRALAADPVAGAPAAPDLAGRVMAAIREAERGCVQADDANETLRGRAAAGAIRERQERVRDSAADGRSGSCCDCAPDASGAYGPTGGIASTRAPVLPSASSVDRAAERDGRPAGRAPWLAYRYAGARPGRMAAALASAALLVLVALVGPGLVPTAQDLPVGATVAPVASGMSAALETAVAALAAGLDVTRAPSGGRVTAGDAGTGVPDAVAAALEVAGAQTCAFAQAAARAAGSASGADPVSALLWWLALVPIAGLVFRAILATDGPPNTKEALS